MSYKDDVIKAKELYPVGTRFRSLRSGTIFTITADVKYWSAGDDIRCDFNRFHTQKGKYSPYLKYNGIWAEIISKPVPQIINNYEIY